MVDPVGEEGQGLFPGPRGEEMVQEGGTLSTYGGEVPSMFSLKSQVH